MKRRSKSAYSRMGASRIGASRTGAAVAEGRPLRGRAALVTGGGNGIGKAISLALGRAGANVMVNYRSARVPARKVADEIQAAGGEAAVVSADVSLSRGAKKAVDTTVQTFGRLDVLINNVGEFLHEPLLKVKPEGWRRIIGSNLDSSFFCSSYASVHMRKQKWGRIVNIGVAGCDSIRAFPNTTAYNVAKTGVLILTRSLAKELAPFGVTVNVVAPGLADTGTLPEREMRKAERGLPMRRAATLGEIAATVLFLVSEDASYVTGSCIPISGGWLL